MSIGAAALVAARRQRYPRALRRVAACQEDVRVNTSLKTLCCALACAAACSVAATEPAQSAPAATVKPEAAAETQSAQGMRAYVDPETGALSSTPVTAEQQQAAETPDPSFRQDDAGVAVIRMPDGSKMAHLNGRFEVAMVATVAADGSIQTECNDVEGHASGTHSHAAPAAPAAPEAPAAVNDDPTR